jgi:uncharacterized membrane protein (DUF2068 family)
MQSERKPPIRARRVDEPPPIPKIEHVEPTIKRRAPTLYAIIAFKIVKGILFIALAVVLYCESTHDLPKEYRAFLNSPFAQTVFGHLRIHPENRFFTHLAEQIGDLTEAKVRWAALGTLVWSLFPLVEGIGMVYRISWAGWLAIGESAFFVPIEIYEIARKFSWFMLLVMVTNVFIVYYLYHYRNVLFRHHHHHHHHPRLHPGRNGDTPAA